MLLKVDPTGWDPQTLNDLMSTYRQMQIKLQELVQLRSGELDEGRPYKFTDTKRSELTKEIDKVNMITINMSKTLQMANMLDEINMGVNMRMI